MRYGTPEAVALAESWMTAIEQAAYRASAELAREKGAFPLYDAERFLAAPNVQRLPEEVRSAIARHGMRNGLVTSIAPTGTISLLAGNVSSGIEPVFDFRYERRVLERDGSSRTETVEDYAHALYRQTFGAKAPLTPAFVTAEELTPRAHLEMQAALQRHVDSSISKTINCPADISFEAFKDIYLEAYDLGLKGCTTYRPNAVTGAVLSRSAEVKPAQAAAGRGRRGPRRRSRSWPTRRCFPGWSFPIVRARSSTWPSRSSARGCWPATPTSSDGPAPIMPCTSPSTTSRQVVMPEAGLRHGGGRSRSSSTPRTSSTTPGPWRSRA